MNERRITIIGGGLAGLTLGIKLRQADIPVTIEEAGSYPRHKVCGEFISGQGQQVIEQLNLTTLLSEHGATPAKTILLASDKKHSPVIDLPTQALCISRYSLDQVLSDQFKQLGGDLQENQFVTPTTRPGVVSAIGRKPKATEGGWRWYGVKIHARQVQLDAHLEMHLVPNGYVGLCRLSNDVTNVCGLFRSRSGQKSANQSGANLLRGAKGSLLNERLRAAEMDEDSYSAVAGLHFGPPAPGIHPFSIGDHLTMIPPATGNGMSMAIEAADLSAPSLIDYAEGKLSWKSATEEAKRRMEFCFAERLFWARNTHNALFSNLLRSSNVLTSRFSQIGLPLLFHITR